MWAALAVDNLTVSMTLDLIDVLDDFVDHTVHLTTSADELPRCGKVRVGHATS